MNGILKTYNEVREFGFIDPLIGKPGKTEMVFLHGSAIKRDSRGRRQAIPQGAEVRFTLVRGKGGRPQAADCEMVEWSGGLKQHD